MATFCLLHGAWHEPSCWEELHGALRARGHEAAVPELPLHDPRAGYADRVRPALAAVATAAGPIVVVGHSQSSSLAPLIAAQRPVALLVYLCPRFGGLEPPPGAPRPFRPGLPIPETGADGTSSWDPDTAVEAMYPRLAPDAARALAARLRPMAMPPDGYPLAELPEVPAAVICATHDELFEPGWVRFVARERFGVEPIEIATGHFPMVEDPEGLAGVLDGVAGEA